MVCIDLSKPKVVTDKSVHSRLRPKWNNDGFNLIYSSLVENKLREQSININKNVCRSDAQVMVDEAFNNLCDILQESAKEAGVVPQKTFVPKRYWCPELSLLRDQKRFWWSLWVSNGRLP